MSVLDRIIEERRHAIRELRVKTPLAELEASPFWAEPRRPFAEALRRPGGADPVRFIAEIKRASPAAGPIRPGADIAAIAREYEEAGAAALSILTEPLFFDGDPSFLGVARRVARVPILMKDFVVDEWQVMWARSLGADAILLIVAALDRVQLRDLATAAREVGVATLIETHDEAEVDRAVESGAEIVGVNHRDLKSLEIDLGLSERILPRIPRGPVRVAESGIRTREDVLSIERLGFDAILVGDRLMRSPAPGKALRALRGAA
jgi:indole-3-glycerol phosphate synthase